MTTHDWEELVIEGHAEAAHAFVAGFLAARGGHAGGVFGSDVDVEPESLSERVRRLFAAGSHHVFLAPADVAKPLAAALAEHGAAVKLRLEHQRRIVSASFDFRAEVYARDGAKQVHRALLTAEPEGVRVEQLSEAEETHADAHGVELYAPVHEYVYRVSGRILGPLPGVLEMRRRAATLDFVELGRLGLVAHEGR